MFRLSCFLFKIRKICPEIGLGDWKILEPGSPDVLVMQYDWQGSHLVLVHNMSEKPQQVTFTAEETAKNSLENLMKHQTQQPGKTGLHKMKVEEYGYRWYRVGGLLN